VLSLPSLSPPLAQNLLCLAIVNCGGLDAHAGATQRSRIDKIYSSSWHGHEAAGPHPSGLRAWAWRHLAPNLLAQTKPQLEPCSCPVQSRMGRNTFVNHKFPIPTGKTSPVKKASFEPRCTRPCCGAPCVTSMLWLCLRRVCKVVDPKAGIMPLAQQAGLVLVVNYSISLHGCTRHARTEQQRGGRYLDTFKFTISKSGSNRSPSPTSAI
jgi:hypothetical protein